MNGLVLSVVALFCFSASASTNRYFIKTQLLVDGKVVATPQILAIENEAVEMEVADHPGDRFKMKVIATDVNNEKIKNEILMKFNVEYSAAYRMVKSSPQVLIKEGSEATVRLADRQGNRDVQMKVVVVRQ